MSLIFDRDYYKALALHKAMLEVKFYTELEDKTILGSPFISETVEDNLSFIIESLEKKGDFLGVEEWGEGRNLSKDRREWDLLKKRLYSVDYEWSKFNKSKKIEIIKIFSAPFRLSKDLVDELLVKLV